MKEAGPQVLVEEAASVVDDLSQNQKLSQGALTHIRGRAQSNQPSPNSERPQRPSLLLCSLPTNSIKHPTTSGLFDKASRPPPPRRIIIAHIHNRKSIRLHIQYPTAYVHHLFFCIMSDKQRQHLRVHHHNHNKQMSDGASGVQILPITMSWVSHIFSTFPTYHQ